MLDYGVAAIGDRNLAAIGHFGTAVALVDGDFGESGEDIGGGDALGYLANQVAELLSADSKRRETGNPLPDPPDGRRDACHPASAVAPCWVPIKACDVPGPQSLLCLVLFLFL